MKNVANCDNYCELHLVNHQVFERILHSLVFQRVHLFQYHINPQRRMIFFILGGNLYPWPKNGIYLPERLKSSRRNDLLVHSFACKININVFLILHFKQE